MVSQQQENQIVPNPCPNGQCPVIGDTDFITTFDQTTVAGFILNVAQFFTYIIGALAVLFIVFAGFQIVTDFGDGARAERGKKNLFSSIIGLIIAIVAYTVVQLIGQALTGNLLGDVLTTTSL